MFSVAWHPMMVFAEFTINFKGLSNHKSFVVVFFFSFLFNGTSFDSACNVISTVIIA